MLHFAKFKGPPGHALPISPAALQSMNMAKLPAFIQKCQNEYGDTFHLNVFGQQIVFLSNLDDAKRKRRRKDLVR